jgi:hypothetical protein
MKKLQTVYIPTKEALNEGFSTQDFNSLEGYFFTPEELKQLLEDYTNRIVENAEVNVKGYNDYEVDKKSITSQLPLYLKEIGL